MKDLFELLKAKYRKAGASLNVTRSALSLGAQNATTGLYAKSYADTTIQMAIDIPRVTVHKTSVGKIPILKTVGVTDTAVEVGDLIKTGAFSEYISNGGFEGGFTDWTQAGSPLLMPDDDDGNPMPSPHGGSRFIKLKSTASVEQTLSQTVPVSDLNTLIKKWHVDRVVPRSVGSERWHYECHLSTGFRLVAGAFHHYYSITVPTDYGNGNAKWKITVTYTDASTTVINYDVTEGFDANGYTAWALGDFTSSLTAGKVIQKIKIEKVTSTHDVFIDDVSCYV